jgi:hypothetical protein
VGIDEKEEKRAKLKKKIEEDIVALKATHQDLKTKVGEANELAQKVDAILKGVNAKKTELETIYQTANNTVQNTNTQLQNVQTQLKNSQTQATEINTLKTNAQTNFNQLQQLHDAAAKSKTDVAAASAQLAEKMAALDKLKTDFSKTQTDATDAYEDLKTENEKKYEDLFKKINSLLPGATSVGLAKSFGERRSAYRKPRIIWAATGIGALIFIILFATVFGTNILSVNTWSDFGLTLTRKLPVVLPLIWIAYFGFHQFGILSRIEEEYAHKEAVSKSFEGYKTQLKDETHPANPRASTGMEKLVNQTLDAVAKPPADAYDTKTKPVMPSDEVLGKATELLKGLGGQAQSSIPTKWAIAGGSAGGALILLILSMAWKLFFGMPHQDTSVSPQEVHKAPAITQPASSPAKP